MQVQRPRPRPSSTQEGSELVAINRVRVERTPRSEVARRISARPGMEREDVSSVEACVLDLSAPQQAGGAQQRGLPHGGGRDRGQ